MRFCRHRNWAALDAIWTVLPDDSISMTWTVMECVRCHKIRRGDEKRLGNVLKAHETIILTVEGLDEGITY